MTLNLADLFEDIARALPHRLALVTADKRQTFSELERRSNRVALSLTKIGVGRDEYVPILAHNCVEWVEAMLAIFKIRAIPLQLNYRCNPGELSNVLGRVPVRAIVVEDTFLSDIRRLREHHPKVETVLVIGTESTPVLEDGEIRYDSASTTGAKFVRPQRSERDLFVFCTGGTTGSPKIAIWYHRDILFARFGALDHPALPFVARTARQVVDRAVESPRRSTLVAGPLMHGAAVCWTLSSLFLGYTVIINTMHRFSARHIWETITEEQPNILTIAGSAMGLPLMDEYERHPSRYDASSLECIRTSAAAMTADVASRIRSAFPRVLFVDHVGASETGILGYRTLDEIDLAASGITLTPADNVVVLADDGRPVQGTDTIGLVARHTLVAQGFATPESADTWAFVEREGRRWASAGDLARITDDGRITLVGRAQNCINSGGEKVFAEEVQSVLASCPGIRDVLVVAAPHPRWGECVAAIVVPRPHQSPPDLSDVTAYCSARMSAFKVPRRLFLVDRIQRHPSGKPDYSWARQIVAASELVSIS